MKRYLAVLFTLAALAASVLPAFATPHWYAKEVKWRSSRFENGSSTTPVRVDTAFAHVGPVGVADTSQWFLPDRLYLPSVLAPTDSITAGYWVFVSDTSATYTATLTALTVATDAGAWTLTSASMSNAFIIQDQVIAAVYAGASQLVATGDKIVVVPLQIGIVPTNSIATKRHLIQFSPLRCRITAGVGAQGLAQARVYFVYLRDET